MSSQLIALEPIVAAEDLFSGLDPESGGNDDRKFEVKKSSNLDEIIGQYIEMFRLIKSNNITKSLDIYKLCRKLVPRDCQKSEIADFSVSLQSLQSISEYEDIKTGLYLSALINESRDNDFVVFIRHLKRKIAQLGEYNTKNFRVYGDVGSYVGCTMLRGKIVVDGDAQFSPGFQMRGGEIDILGEIGYIHDQDIKYGKIYHKGKLIVKDGKVLE